MMILFLRMLLVCCAVIATVADSPAKTLVLSGNLSSRIKMAQRITFTVSEPKDSLTYRFALPYNGSTRSVNQQIIGLTTEFSPEAASVKDETDRFGNHFRIVTWKNLKSDAHLTLAYEIALKSELQAMESRIPFPLKSVPTDEQIYLQASEQVQSNSPAIKAKARELVSGTDSEYAAVTAIMRFVANHITYGYNPPRYDALYALETGDGNCQNYAHLALALLRASGIPGRAVGGFSLKDQWKIPIGKGASLVQGMGQGGHAWLEIYFPDLGWLSYDPQQSMQFTSTRHIKQTHGLQIGGIVDTWQSATPLPTYGEILDSTYLDDKVNLTLAGESPEPRGYLVSNKVTTVAELQIPVIPATIFKPKPEPQPKIEPKPEPKPEPKLKPESKPKPTKPPTTPDKEHEIVFGNMKFPSLVEIYQTTGDTGTRLLDRETAEYVTSKNIYAQAFNVDKTMHIQSVSLAMKKFGGDGTVYLDVVADNEGKPGHSSGVRSQMIYLDQVKRQPGYAWIDFRLPPDSDSFKPGKYWIVLRSSGDAFMNWFYIPGKRYGDPEDTRSTARGWQWEDILNYEFVFKVSGKAK